MINFQKIGMIATLVNLITISATFAVKNHLPEFEKFSPNPPSPQAPNVSNDHTLLLPENSAEGEIYSGPAFFALPPEMQASILISNLKNIIQARELGTQAEHQQAKKYKSKKRKLDEIYI